MKYKNLISEHSTIDLHNNYISIIKLKNKIKKSFNAKVISETSTSFSYRIIRFARIFGAPVLFSNPIFNVEILRHDKNTTIECELIVFDYFAIYIGVVVLGFILFFTELGSPDVTDLKENILILFAAFVIGNVAVLLDSKYFLYLLKKELKKEIRKYKV